MSDFKITRSDELMHYRTKGSKNGVRLYQNPDGSLTPLGERHYRDMYGYGERDGSSNKTLAQLRRERLGRSVSGEKQTNSVSSPVKVTGERAKIDEYAPYVRITGESLFPDNRFRNPPTERVKIDEYAPYVRITGKSLFSDPEKASSEYLEEINYNSKKNEYPGQSGRSVTVAPNTNKNVKGAPQGKVFRDTSMGPTLFKQFADDPNEVREIGTNYVTYPQIVGKYDSKKADLYEDPRNFQKTPGDKTAPLYKPREDMKEKLRSEYKKDNYIPRDQREVYIDTPIKEDVYNENGARTRFGTTSLNRMNEFRIEGEKFEEMFKKEKAEKERAEKERAEKERAEKERAEKEKAEKERAEKERAEKEKAESLSGRLQSAYDTVSKAVVDTADKVKTGATDAYSKASDAVVDAADKAKGALDQAYKDAEKWVTTAADDVKKTASEAFDAGKEWVEQAGKDVGDFVNNTVSDVTKAVDDAKNGVVDAANTVGKAAQDGWNWVKNLFGGGNKQDESKHDEEKKKNTRRTPSPDLIDENFRSVRTRYEK